MKKSLILAIIPIGLLALILERTFSGDDITPEALNLAIERLSEETIFGLGADGYQRAISSAYI
ncbi:MAG: hypothetical protein JKY51_06805 [Opitutaceae bacterium]|nr:hypothetical protein [Opitutaceae bacterium]